ncbi:MAG: peptidylprolyl isomerase [Sulfurimonas sp.]|uniref:peptidylprolyl isomerase n=1 Tax=Sulfurimonas sp. TaxID=2022749 RepID=UPI0026054BD0|nr:peptidylprolyl isomerase [Sulfurimonas sp.]MDD2651856.1 peptidylprolyl isomerase [Sulfurimonas sp.]MDD3451827.1 peptidylprolyl isomerase [Sulfurimonas sp.]
MFKIVLVPFLFATLLSAELINGVSAVVKGEPITLQDVSGEMRLSKTDAMAARDILIRKKLEAAEIVERKISVNSTEVYEDIKKMAASNKMSIDQLYDTVRESNGLNSAEFKEKIKEKLLSQKLYSAIAYASMEAPSEEVMKEYYELHKEEFSRPKAFVVTLYSSSNEEALRKKIATPVLSSSEVKIEERTLPYDTLSPELAQLLEKTEPKSFTPIIMDQKGAYMSFYVKETQKPSKSSYEEMKSQLANLVMGAKREQVLSDYFARLRGNADIVLIREAK